MFWLARPGTNKNKLLGPNNFLKTNFSPDICTIRRVVTPLCIMLRQLICKQMETICITITDILVACSS